MRHKLDIILTDPQKTTNQDSDITVLKKKYQNLLAGVFASFESSFLIEIAMENKFHVIH